MFTVMLVSMPLVSIDIGDVMALKVGDKEPDFTLPITTDENIILSRF